MKRLIVGLCLTFMMASFPIVRMTQYNVVQAETKEQLLDSECVEGKVLSDVNVRTGAGSKYKKVVVDGETIFLKKGQLISIIEDPDHKQSSWYKVKIMVNGQEIIGYSSSKYIKKTGKVITPTEVPTKVPTPVPTKVPTPVPTVEIGAVDSNTTKTDLLIEEETSVANKANQVDNKDSSLVWYISVIVVLVGGVGISLIYCSKKSKKRSQRMDELAAKIAEQTKKEISRKPLSDNHIECKEREEKVTDSIVDEEKEDQQREAHSDIRVMKGDQVISRDKLINGNRSIYVKEKQKEVITAQMELAATLIVEQPDSSNTTENSSKYRAKSLQDKEQFRLQLNELKEHDKIVHKYFGEGEVYDNSDVRLIEIRFGRDTRFLNKDNLAVNHLLSIVEKQ